MTITIDIPDNIATVFDAHLRQARGTPDPQSDGSVIIRPRFPEGVKTWIAEAVQANIRDLASQLADQLPGVKTLRDEILAKQQELNNLLRPVVKTAESVTIE